MHGEIWKIYFIKFKKFLVSDITISIRPLRDKTYTS